MQLNQEFAYYYLSTLTDGLRERIKQGSGQPNLNTDIVKDISIPIPSKKETEDIVWSIHKTREQYKKLTEKAVTGIELLQERRTALILRSSHRKNRRKKLDRSCASLRSRH